MDGHLKKLKEQYKMIPIPEELDLVVDQALQKSAKRRVRSRWISSVCAASMLFLVGINVSTTVANAFTAIPAVGSIVKVLTIREYIVKEERHDANIKIPEITNLTDKALELGLNTKYWAEGKELYEQFVKDAANADQARLGIDAGYTVKTDTEEILAIGRYVVNTVGSSSTTMKYDTIDKKNEILLTLPMLFRDEQYVETISANIIQQMKERMKADSQNFYWIAADEGAPSALSFERIRPDQNFYIDANGHLVISFDKYEVAPGYMGIQEFVIPTETIADDLAGHYYIR